jgi:spore maturation protein CgeB
MCAFLASVRLSVNVPFSGTEATMQVKGRVIESALAGACLMEAKGAPTARWFTPGEDYVEYANVGELFGNIERLSKDPAESERIALNLRRKVLAEHSPAIFWSKVMARIGMRQAA